MSKKENGFGIVEILLILVAVGLVVALGWVFIGRQNVTQSDTQTAEGAQSSTATQQSSTEQQPVDDSGPVPDEPYKLEPISAWVKKTDPATRVQYAAPSGWTDGVKVDKFVVDENIHVGYGIPASVRYSSSAQAWQTLTNDENNNPTIVSAYNDVSTIASKAEGKYLVGTYATGDGTGAQYRLLVLKDSDVYQFSLPATCEEVICAGDKKWTMAQLQASMSEFVKTIVF